MIFCSYKNVMSNLVIRDVGICVWFKFLEMFLILKCEIECYIIFFVIM